VVRRKENDQPEGPSAGGPAAEVPTEESSVYARGQTVIPKMIREAAAIDYGTRLHWEVHEGVIHVIPMPKDPIAAARGILKGKGPTFKEFIADRNRERARERKLEEEETRRWRSSSIRPRS
jgi:bifunctional DNA-binding transcriptional regulator/antitoxin component of YhaV-PrlF toxin-antitoxin module